MYLHKYMVFICNLDCDWHAFHRCFHSFLVLVVSLKMSREKIWREKAHCQEQVFLSIHAWTPLIVSNHDMIPYIFTYTPLKKDSNCRENIPKSSNPDFSCSFWEGKETISREKEFLRKAKAGKTLDSNYSLLINLYEYQKQWCCLLLYHQSKLRDFVIPPQMQKRLSFEILSDHADFSLHWHL